ncbi:hypothetical protein F4801DRAFT_541568 [Xylaria longipes]|nr:hypothetical protein F4801DRAFT_541568 [Xylaria longipes]
MPGRPPIAQNPQLAAGVAVNFNAQAQAQVGFNQQYQYPLARPVMVNIPPPPPLPPPPAIINVGAPSTQAQAQVNVDAANLANAAVIVGSAVGAAFHHNNSQPQQGHAQSNHTPHSESHNESHGYATENHGGAYEQAYGSSVPPPPATYMDNSYVAADTTYADNSSYSINNTYIDNTEVVNNTIYIDDSTAVVSDMTYNNTGYADAATYSGTEITTDMALDVNVNSAVYTDSSATGFSMDESMNMASSSDFTVASADYSGGGWGDFDF